jgi:hypothetical protein
MRHLQTRTVAFEIRQTCTYIVQGTGTSDFEAEQDAIERFHRLSKSGDLVALNVSKPRVHSKGQ